MFFFPFAILIRKKEIFFRTLYKERGRAPLALPEREKYYSISKFEPLQSPVFDFWKTGRLKPI